MRHYRSMVLRYNLIAWTMLVIGCITSIYGQDHIRVMAEIDSLIGESLFRIDKNPAEARVMLHYTDSLSQTIAYRKGRLASTLNNAIIDYRSGDYDKGADSLAYCLEQCTLHNYKKLKSRVLVNLGALNGIKGNYDVSQQFNFELLELAEEIQDSLQIANALRNIGNIYAYSEEHKSAIDFYDRAAVIFKALGYDNRVGGIIYNKGHILFAQEKYDEALQLFQQYYAIVIDSRNDKRKAQALESIGKTYEKLNRLNKAREFILKARAGFAKLDDNFNIIGTHVWMGRIYSIQSQHTKAIHEIETSLSLSREINSRNRHYDVFEAAVDIYNKANRYEKALNYMDSMAVLRDSIWTRDKFKTIEELHEKYNAEKKETQLTLLEKDQKLLLFKNRLHLLLVISLFFISALLAFMYWSIRKKNIRLFSQLQEQVSRKLDMQIIESSMESSTHQRKKALEIPDSVKKEILVHLEKWVGEQKFLEHVDHQELAKELGTNTKYLSLVIKDVHEVSFNEYLNNLRISYVLEELQFDKELRNYTIDHIAMLAGFGSRKTFAKAFKRYTGLLPSFYIRELKTRTHI